jgi:hypothetical protein
MQEKTFIKIRDIGKEKPDQFLFVETGLAGKNLIPVGYMKPVEPDL